MKKCPKCDALNFDNATLCENCSAYIADVEADSTNVIEAIMLKEEKSERFWKVFHIMLAVLYYVLYIPLFVICFRKSNHTPVGVLLLPATFPLFYYLCVFKAEAMFKLKHIFHVYNVDDIELTDWYYVTSKIAGYIFLVMGIVCMFNFVPREPSGNDIVVSTTWSVFGNTLLVIPDEPTGQQLVVERGSTEGIPYDVFLKKNNAVFLENSEEARNMLETTYIKVRDGMIVYPPIILVDGEKVYEFIFNGENLKMCETAPCDSASGIETTYHYNCKIEKIDKGYLVTDFRTGLRLEFTF